MRTTIQWFTPAERRPPFYKEIILVMGGHFSRGGPFHPYRDVFSGQVLDTDPDGSVDNVEALRRGDFEFTELQFCVANSEQVRAGVEPMDIVWYSDSIALWAHIPDEIRP